MDDTETEPVEVLLAEDNPGDVRLTEKAFEQGGVLNNLHVVNDGDEALAFLRQKGEYADAPRPNLVLLDINMPNTDGTTVLETMQADEQLARIPVVMLTSSEAEEDIVRSYDLGANAYLTKPVDFDGFIDVIERIEDFWLTVVEMPED
ncbi:response regulator [Halomicroarcula sp. GCM10025709]|uniref:response regulator n=1 Tax=Haloarcula TaxID=2237 RepID=UPI0036232D3B